MALAIVILGGCGIDVNRRPLGPNQFLVEAEGRDYHSHADVLEAAHHEAAAACGGPYRVLDNVNSTHDHGGHDGLVTPTLDVVLTIECGGRAPGRGRAGDEHGAREVVPTVA